MNETRWTIEFYRDPRGREPVAEFIRTLSTGMYGKLFRDIDLLEEHGPRLSMPFARPLAGYRFSELRTQFAGDIVRVFHYLAPGRRIILLHGFAKKTQRTPRNELAIAAARLDTFLRS